MAQAWGACDLAVLWAKRTDVTLLDTDFGQGQGFLHAWNAWREARMDRPRMLHYVGIAASAPTGCVATNGMAQALFAACSRLEPGFHRITLKEGHEEQEGQVSLTLCLGEKKTMLAEQRLQADGVWIATPEDAFWDEWSVKLLAQRCRRGASVFAPAWNPLFALAGFERACERDTQDGGVGIRYNPPWRIPTSRSSKASRPMTAPGRCAVVGAGMAGASAAHTLAQRGWQVQVFDQESSPAAAASGVPVGLAVPQLSVDDNPRSRITRCGIRLLLQQARSLLQQDQDWSPSGVLERRADDQAVWHPQAAWIKPARLVRTWLRHPAIRLVTGTRIERLTCANALWQLHDAHNRVQGDFELVVLANALGCIPLLRGILPVLPPAVQKLQAMHGTVSHGRHAEAIPNLPPTPINGHGYFIPAVPVAAGTQWLLGATFEPDTLKAADVWAQHTCNMQRLPQLWPPGGTELGETLERGPLELWSATRCVSPDRLPLLGPLHTSAQAQLWLYTGLGSRGLSFAPLCAELLAASLMGEPLPLESSLAAKLDANRAQRTRKPDVI